MATATATVVIQYDDSKPPEGFAIAAQAGDLAAIQAAADWYRDRGQPAHPTDESRPSDEVKAYEVEAYKADVDQQLTEARNNRALLAKWQAVFGGRRIRRQRATEHAINTAFGEYGITARSYRIRSGFIIGCPTDHIEEDTTRAALLVFLERQFYRTTFDLQFGNTRSSLGGYRGKQWVGKAPDYFERERRERAAAMSALSDSSSADDAARFGSEAFLPNRRGVFYREGMASAFIYNNNPCPFRDDEWTELRRLLAQSGYTVTTEGHFPPEGEEGAGYTRALRVARNGGAVPDAVQLSQLIDESLRNIGHGDELAYHHTAIDD